MKTLAKVFTIIYMVVGGIAIIPLIIGIIALKRLNTAKTRSELLGIGIVSIIFGNILGGIFTLIYEPALSIKNIAEKAKEHKEEKAKANDMM